MKIPGYILKMLDQSKHFEPKSKDIFITGVRHDLKCRRPEGFPCTCNPIVEWPMQIDEYQKKHWKK